MGFEAVAGRTLGLGTSCGVQPLMENGSRPVVPTGAIKIWDTATSEELWTLRGHTKNVTLVAFRPDGRRLASSSSDQTIKIWDSTASPVGELLRGAAGPIARIAYFPDGNHILVAEKRRGRRGERASPLDNS